MIARIGIADTGRDVEVAIDSKDEFVSRVEAAYEAGQQILWMKDTKGKDVGVPLTKIAYIEISGEEESSVGF